MLGSSSQPEGVAAAPCLKQKLSMYNRCSQASDQKDELHAGNMSPVEELTVQVMITVQHCIQYDCPDKL